MSVSTTVHVPFCHDLSVSLLSSSAPPYFSLFPMLAMYSGNPKPSSTHDLTIKDYKHYAALTGHFYYRLMIKIRQTKAQIIEVTLKHRNMRKHTYIRPIHCDN